MRWASIIGDVILFSPAPLLIAGWVKWLLAAVPRGWRQNVIAIGLGSASISCLCLYGVVLHLQKAHVGYWNEYLVASHWGALNWPISLAAVILALVGRGASRGFLALAGVGLVLEWTMAFIH